MVKPIYLRKLHYKFKKFCKSKECHDWLMIVIRQVISYLIRNYSNDFITWSKHILELLFNS